MNQEVRNEKIVLTYRIKKITKRIEQMEDIINNRDTTERIKERLRKQRMQLYSILEEVKEKREKMNK